MTTRPGTAPALLAAVIALAAAAHYLSVILGQARDLAPMPIEVGVWFIAGYAAGGGVLAAVSVVAQRGRVYVLGAASGMIGFIASIGMLSSLALTFGLGLMLATGLTATATVRVARAEGTSRAAAGAAALAMYILGIGGYIATIVLPRG